MEKGTVVLDIEEYNRIMGIVSAIDKAEGNVVFIDKRKENNVGEWLIRVYGFPAIPELRGEHEVIKSLQEEFDRLKGDQEEQFSIITKQYSNFGDSKKLRIKIHDLEEELIELRGEKWWKF